jgi:hypothetical protein
MVSNKGIDLGIRSPRAARLLRTMEVLLNATWFLVAIGAFLLWQPGKHGRRSWSRGYSPCFGMVALACALILLFPVISLTDDLHAEQVAMEDSSRTLNGRQVAQGARRDLRSPLFPAVILVCSFVALTPVCAGTVIAFAPQLFCVTPLRACEGRSPPHSD